MYLDLGVANTYLDRRKKSKRNIYMKKENKTNYFVNEVN